MCKVSDNKNNNNNNNNSNNTKREEKKEKKVGTEESGLAKKIRSLWSAIY